MRLLDTRTIQLTEFPPNQIPPYAVLSHTWDDEEVSLQDVLDEGASEKRGYVKVAHSCAQALRDGYNYIWIDTCCIDKSSSAELSEAINSMFVWYNRARICYAYLADVLVPESDVPRAGTEEGADLVRGLWFTRGWTLQELLAPERVRFYSAEWHFLGDRKSLAERISHITGIHVAFLEGLPLRAASIAEKMSWAADRKTTREEDIAYSLLGIFDVHMPLLYGEGGLNAFFRLQEELLRKYDDQSLYAWHSKDVDPVPATLEWDTLRRSQGGGGWARAAITTGVLARSPNDFRECGDIVVCEFEGAAGHHSTMTNAGILIELPVCKFYGADTNASYALLKCRRRHDFVNALAIPIERDGDTWHRTLWPVTSPKCLKDIPSRI
ncbi:HET-domain-containing protein [Thozetella sp. PMI_491]|nr:HET-domain-containing protein [Thozetella sp. PMI_491]